MTDFPINFGLMAIDRRLNIVHFCAFETPPSEGDLEALKKELATDPEFGLVEAMKADNVRVMEAPPEVVEQYRVVVEKGEMTVRDDSVN